MRFSISDGESARAWNTGAATSGLGRSGRQVKRRPRPAAADRRQLE